MEFDSLAKRLHSGAKRKYGSILNRVSGEYFETVGIPIVAGRAISDADSTNSLRVAVINQTLANRYFPKGDALGQSVTLGIDSAKGPWRIVGIARDTKSSNPRNIDPIRMTYLPLAQIEPYLPAEPATLAQQNNSAGPLPRAENQDRFADVILLRCTGNPTHAIAALRSAVSSVDPNLPLLKVTTIQEEISNFISNDELISTLTGLFSLVALLLAAIGLYGVMTYDVECRRSEIGIRLALGAQPQDVQWMVFRESLLLLAVGLGLGLPLAVCSRDFIKHQLFGLSFLDPASFGVALTVVSAITLLASWLPARGASKVDPMVALRAD